MGLSSSGRFQRFGTHRPGSLNPSHLRSRTSSVLHKLGLAPSVSHQLSPHRLGSSSRNPEAKKASHRGSSSSVEDHRDLLDLPPGFRFHPIDEEIIKYYLAEKVVDSSFVAMNKCGLGSAPVVVGEDG